MHVNGKAPHARMCPKREARKGEWERVPPWSARNMARPTRPSNDHLSTQSLVKRTEWPNGDFRQAGGGTANGGAYQRRQKGRKTAKEETDGIRHTLARLTRTSSPRPFSCKTLSTTSRRICVISNRVPRHDARRICAVIASVADSGRVLRAVHHAVCVSIQGGPGISYEKETISQQDSRPETREARDSSK